MKKYSKIPIVFLGLVLSTSALANVMVTLSPNDTYIARFELGTSVRHQSLPGNAFYLCGALKSYCLSGINSPYGTVTNNGIVYSIIEGRVSYYLGSDSYYTSYLNGDSCNSFPPSSYKNAEYAECANNKHGLSIGFISPKLKGKLASGDVSVTAVEIKTKNIKPGRYSQRVYLDESLHGGQWSVASFETIDVIVRDTTCTIQNKTVDMGTILPGNEKQKKLNLGLSCTNRVAGASWEYSNLNPKGGNNTNLKNVTLKIKNKK